MKNTLLNQFLFSFFVSVTSLFTFTNLIAQDIDVNNIDIVRDEYGIPHIFTKTNAEAVYGLAWAQCEDNFPLMQGNFGSTKGMAGRIIGKDGAVLDLLFEVFEIEKFVEERYEKDVSPEMETILNAYAAAINKYAETHPSEVIQKGMFPINARNILANYTLQFHLMHGSIMELGKILSDDFDYETLMENAGKGSNAMAYSPEFTTDGKTYLVGNPHQPLNEMGNFWEVSLHSEEGYEMYGVTFSVGGVTPVIGSNRNLGWSHTTNYHNCADIYKLEMNPNEKLVYKYDGEWLQLEEKKVKLKVKVGPLTIPVSKKYFMSKYGPTFKKKSGYYSFKIHSSYNLKGPEQWYKMGLAKNIEEFEAALDLQGLVAQTITYGDKDGNIFHLSNFIHPLRDEKYDWTKVLDGNTSGNNWNFDKVHPIADLPRIKNPKCGYVYNCNNTVFRMSAPEENLKPEDFPKSFGLLTSNTIRANNFERLIKKYDKISFEEAREIREDVSLDKNNMSFRNCMNCSDIPVYLAKYPEFADLKKVFDEWNGEFTIDNKQASAVALTSMHVTKYVRTQFGNIEKDMPEEEIVKALRKSQKFLMKHYGTLEVELGKIQKAVRHDVEMPMYGGPNTLACCHLEKYKKGKWKIKHGDTYIIYAKYGKDGLEEMNTINAFGNSLREGHPHSTDQTEMYVNKQTKKIELDLKKLKKSGEMYHPK